MKKNLNVLQTRLDSFKGSKIAGSKTRSKKNIVKWPHETPSPSDLATAGFFFDPTPENPDNVTCFHCQRSLDGWEPQDNAAIEHLVHSEDCAWAKLIAKPWNKFDKSDLMAKPDLNPHGTEAINCRLETFIDWPHENKKGWLASTGLSMAKAGFFFNPVTDNDDTTSCPYCEISLGGWEPEDSPFIEHQKRSPECLFFTVPAITESDSPRGRKRASSLTSARKKSAIKKSRTSNNIDTALDQNANKTLNDSDSDIILKIPKRGGKNLKTTSSRGSSTVRQSNQMVYESTPEKKKGRTQRATSTVSVEDGSMTSISSILDESIPGAFPIQKKKQSLKLKKTSGKTRSENKKEIPDETRSVTITVKDGIIIDPDDTVEEELAQLELEEKLKMKKADEVRKEKILKEEEELMTIRNQQKLEREKLAQELEEKQKREKDLEILEQEARNKEEREREEFEALELQKKEELQNRENEATMQSGDDDVECLENNEKELTECGDSEHQEEKGVLQCEETHSQKQAKQPLQVTSPQENWHRFSSSTATTTNLQSDRRQQPFSLTSPFSLATPYGTNIHSFPTPAEMGQTTELDKENLEPMTPLSKYDNAPIQSPQKWESTDLAKVFKVLESIEADFSTFQTLDDKEDFMDLTVSQWISFLADKSEKLMQTKCEEIIKMIQYRGEKAIAAVESIPVKGF